MADDASLDRPPSPPSPPSARRRLWLTLAGISLGWKLLVLTLGAAVPRWIISDGVSELPAEVRDHARQATHIARDLWNGPIERRGGIVRAVHVVSVERDVPEAAACGGYQVRVRAYTYFAIPYSEARTRCGRGVVEYRVFRRYPAHGR